MIDDEIIESFVNCKYKAYLKHDKQIGDKTELELLHRDLLKINKEKYYNTLRVKSHNHQILKKFRWDKKHNIEKINYAIAPAFQTREFNINFAALEIRPPSHSMRRISYIPILISPREKVAKFEKIFLSIQCLILSKQRDITFEFGKIIYGNELKATKFKLDVYSKESERALHELTRIISNKETPAFYHNNHCKICEFQEVCKAKLVEKDDLSLLGRFSQKEIIKTNNRGIFTVHQFSYTFKPRRRRKHPDKPHRFEYALKALALREKQSYIQEIPKLPSCKTEIYLDFEGLPDENFIYLIGIVIREDEVERQLSFWADSKDEEEKIFRQLFELVSKFDDFTVYHYGSYEIKSLKKLNRKLDNKYENEINPIVEKSFNILSLFTTSIYPPTYTNELKDIAGFLGFKWSDKKASGIQSIVWRKKWELSKDVLYKDKLIQYNIEDCLALNLAKNWLACIRGKLEQEPNGNFAKVEDLKVESRYPYILRDFKAVIPDFETINKCAYFDYQRNKIYLKTNRSVKKAIKKKAKENKSVDRINKTIEIPVPKKCPYCNHSRIRKQNRRRRNIIDLKFTRDGIKKWVICYQGNRALCCNCGRMFTPGKHKKKTKYGHNLAAWVINQFITHRINLNTLVNILSESFNIKLPPSTLKNFKKNLAEEYQETFEEIQQDIVNGSLIHADETTVKVKGFSSPYIWVFTNMGAVFYLFRPNREADFLKELLKNFRGVLVSDFYSGYDSLPCQQQKCLIHLMRDLNEDLFKNQLNIELKGIATKFGALLRMIVETIDKYGLKKRHLNKHKKDVERFYSEVFNQKYETDIAISYQKRFKKNKGKLFTFLNFDNVPWNNNNAEHAIIPYAKYRRERDSMFSESTINEYLILLSIQQTCKLRGISFLDFLKSGEKSINKYCERS